MTPVETKMSQCHAARAHAALASIHHNCLRLAIPQYFDLDAPSLTNTARNSGDIVGIFQSESPDSQYDIVVLQTGIAEHFRHAATAKPEARMATIDTDGSKGRLVFKGFTARSFIAARAGPGTGTRRGG